MHLSGSNRATYPTKLQPRSIRCIKDLGELYPGAVTAKISGFHLDGAVTLKPTAVFLGGQTFCGSVGPGYLRADQCWNQSSGSILGTKYYHDDEVEEAWYELVQQTLAANSGSPTTPNWGRSNRERQRDLALIQWLVDQYRERHNLVAPQWSHGSHEWQIVLPRLRIPRPRSA